MMNLRSPSRRPFGLTAGSLVLAAVAAVAACAAVPSAAADGGGGGGERVHRVERRVPVGSGRWLQVTEAFTAESHRRRPHRAVVFLSGSVFHGNHWTVPFPGYDGAAMAARRGFFAYTVDYLGVGESFTPADGRDADFAAQIDAVRALLERIRSTRQVDAVDLVGEGYGAAIATEIAATPGLVRSVTASAQIYREVAAGPLLDPNFIALLESSPDGYFFAPAAGSLIFLIGTPQPVVDYVLATQGGSFPIDNFLAAADRPFYDPTAATAPALVLYGAHDFIAVQSDLEDLVADWGAPAALVVNPDAGHAPRLEAPAIAAWFWEQVFGFIDP